MPKLTGKREVKITDEHGVSRDGFELKLTYSGGLFRRDEDLRVVIDKEVYEEIQKEYGERDQKIVQGWPNTYVEVKDDRGNTHTIIADRWGGIRKIDGDWVR